MQVQGSIIPIYSKKHQHFNVLYKKNYPSSSPYLLKWAFISNDFGCFSLKKKTEIIELFYHSLQKPSLTLPKWTFISEGTKDKNIRNVYNVLYKKKLIKKISRK